MRVIDLRSDTVTRPSAAMRQAMAQAVVGDDVFGDDPTVRELEEYAAHLFGKAAGLFLPSGTMSNQAALLAWTERGDEVFLHDRSHILLYEQAGAAVLGSLQTRSFASADGMLDPEAMEEFVHTGEDPHNARTRVVSLENAHNHCGGRVLDPRGVLGVRLFCDRHGLVLHLDGARVANAAVASVCSVAELAAPFDSVSVCLSKGLGAPVGSVLVGPAEFVKRARRARKLLGGGMRQAGILAAGGLFALRNNIPRLEEDHRRAHALAERLATVPGFSVDLRTVETNMVFVSTRPSGRHAAEIASLLCAAGVLCLAESPWKIRFVTHLDVDDADVAEAGEVVARTMAVPA